MSGLISGLAGAGGAANRTGGYYQNAMNNEVNATGSPAAQQFAAQEQASLQPQFNTQDQTLAAKEAAMGITNSGAAKADYGNLAAGQAATLAGVEAPLYSQALGQYGQINAAMPGAQNNAYQQAIQNFYTAVSDAGSLAAGLPPTATPGNNASQTGAGTFDVGQNSSLGQNVAPNPAYSAYGVQPYAAVPDYNPYSTSAP